MKDWYLCVDYDKELMMRCGRLAMFSRAGTVLGTALGAVALMAVLVPATATAQERNEKDCYTIGEECVPFTEINENTLLYLAFHSDGSATGFTDFGQYQTEVLSEYGVRLELRDGAVVQVPPRQGPPQGQQAQAGLAPDAYAFFYDKPNVQGPKAFAVHSPDFITNLNHLPYPGNPPGPNNWNNRVSSVSTHGGPAFMCTNVNCNTSGTGIFQILPPDLDLTLTGGLNDSASAVGVFA